MARKLRYWARWGELGDQAKHYHEALADDILASGTQLAILVGDEMAHTTAKLKDSLDHPAEIFHVEDSSEALTEVAKKIGDEDILLIKGSNYLGLAKVVTALVSGKY